MLQCRHVADARHTLSIADVYKALGHGETSTLPSAHGHRLSSCDSRACAIATRHSLPDSREKWTTSCKKGVVHFLVDSCCLLVNWLLSPRKSKMWFSKEIPSSPRPCTSTLPKQQAHHQRAQPPRFLHFKVKTIRCVQEGREGAPLSRHIL